MNIPLKKQSAFIGLATVLSIILTTQSLYANQPSFDCDKVEKNSTEGIICNSDTLMDLDRELSDAVNVDAHTHLDTLCPLRYRDVGCLCIWVYCCRLDPGLPKLLCLGLITLKRPNSEISTDAI